MVSGTRAESERPERPFPAGHRRSGREDDQPRALAGIPCGSRVTRKHARRAAKVGSRSSGVRASPAFRARAPGMVTLAPPPAVHVGCADGPMRRCEGVSTFPAQQGMRPGRVLPDQVSHRTLTRARAKPNAEDFMSLGSPTAQGCAFGLWTRETLPPARPGGRAITARFKQQSCSSHRARGAQEVGSTLPDGLASFPLHAGSRTALTYIASAPCSFPLARGRRTGCRRCPASSPRAGGHGKPLPREEGCREDSPLAPPGVRRVGSPP